MLFAPAFRNSLQGYRANEVFHGHVKDKSFSDALSMVQYLDYKTYLPGDILTKVDRASMAHSLEVRVPVLDHELVEWASGLPADLKLRYGEGKYVFKKALEPDLPPEVLYRTKMGFRVPLATWFRGPLRSRLQGALRRGALAESGWFEASVLDRLVRQHVSGRSDHSATLWKLMMLDAFLRRMESPAATTGSRTIEPEALSAVGGVQ
jgi:asparagine synthase (glutamine-hydrolysing)